MSEQSSSNSESRINKEEDLEDWTNNMKSDDNDSQSYKVIQVNQRRSLEDFKTVSTNKKLLKPKKRNLNDSSDQEVSYEDIEISHSRSMRKCPIHQKNLEIICL